MGGVRVSFLTLIHVAGGSTVEAANAVATVGPYATRQEAEDAGEIVYQSVRHIDFLNDECFFTVVEIPDQPQGPHVAIKALTESWGEDEDDSDEDGEGTEIAVESIGDFFESIGDILSGKVPTPPARHGPMGQAPKETKPEPQRRPKPAYKPDPTEILGDGNFFGDNA